jgi:hypothetical protein
LPNALHHRLAAQLAQAVRAAIGCPARGGLVDEEAAAERWVVTMGVEQRVGPIRRDEFAGRDWGGQPR